MRILNLIQYTNFGGLEQSKIPLEGLRHLGKGGWLDHDGASFIDALLSLKGFSKGKMNLGHEG